jgi:acetolactate synthase-1/2/3 large subunit
MGQARLRRGADALLRALNTASVGTVFSLSGNHIMAVYDAVLDHDIRLLHFRQEAATVHAADAWARLTDGVGVALVTGGQGHANAVSALCTAAAAETPLVLLSGHAGLSELGLGAFQEMPQAELAAPLTKASWVAGSAATLPQELARAFRIARSGRPGPVHLSLPSDLLEGAVEADAVAWPEKEAFAAVPLPLVAGAARRVLAAAADAKRPIILLPPALCTTRGRATGAALEAATGIPVVGMESPRGVNDPSLGAFAEMLAQADLLVLLGKPLDFTLRFGRPPTVAASCRWIVVDPDTTLIARAARGLGGRLIFSAIAGPVEAVSILTQEAQRSSPDGLSSAHKAWRSEVREAVACRPAAWSAAGAGQPMSSAAMCGALQHWLARHDSSVFISDGGEIGQWAQALLRAPHRVINGVAGAIGPSIPFCIGAKCAFPDSPVLAVLGDGTFGFHMAEFDTAVRYGLPFVAVIGNDSRWNAEYQIQAREYGPERSVGCTLSPDTRYDLVVAALGGHGEFVTEAEALPAALERAFASGRPACVNVRTDGSAAPVIRRH